MNHSDVNIKLTKTCTTCANVNKTAPLVFQRNILTKYNLICDKHIPAKLVFASLFTSFSSLHTTLKESFIQFMPCLIWLLICKNHSTLFCYLLFINSAFTRCCPIQLKDWCATETRE